MSKLTEAISKVQHTLTPGLEEVLEEGQYVLYMDERHDKFLDYLDDPDMPESLKRVRVVRKGKRIIKFKSNKPGFKIVFTNGLPKEVKIKPAERIRRKRATKKAARKAKGKKSIALQRRKRSLKLVRK